MNDYELIPEVDDEERSLAADIVRMYREATALLHPDDERARLRAIVDVALRAYELGLDRGQEIEAWRTRSW